jgi:hypothetical protein
MPLSTRLTDLATRIGQELKAVWAAVGQLSPPVTNMAADVGASGNSHTYLLGLPVGSRLRVGSILRFTGRVTKTAAGTATPSWTIRVGNAGTTGDTIRLTFAGVAQTAIADEGYFELEVVVTADGAAGALRGHLFFTHRLATTGLQNTQVQVLAATSGAVDLTSPDLIVGLALNPGANGVWTFTTLIAEALGLG